MKKIISQVYKDYPEQPYISPERDLALWESEPELFPYSIVAKNKMQRLPEGVLAGDIIMLWRIHFGNYTNTAVVPEYFEYKYGVDGEESIRTLVRLGFAKVSSAQESLVSLKVSVLKKILERYNLDTKGKKDILLQRTKDNISEAELAKLFSLRRYEITPAGTKVLEKYNDIVQKHGQKM